MWSGASCDPIVVLFLSTTGPIKSATHRTTEENALPERPTVERTKAEIRGLRWGADQV